MEEMQKPQGGAAAEERERFRQVWQRVTESGGGESPIEVVPVQAQERALAAPDPGERLERRCGELRAALGEALAGAAAYEALARRLAVACFLLDGVWYLPQNPGGESRETTVMGGLRERYLAERRGEESSRSAAARAEDGDLANLWLDLAAECRESAQAVRRLLEEL